MAHSSKSTRAKSTRSKSSKSDPDFLYNLPAHLENLELQNADFPSLPKASSPEASPPTRRQSLPRPVQEVPLDKQLQLVQLQKEKLELELEVLRLRQGTNFTSELTTTHGQHSTPQRKKRTI